MRHATDQAMRLTPWSLLAVLLGSSGLLGLIGWLDAATAWTQAAAADRRLDYRPAAYALQNATIVTTPRSTITNGTVIVREGVIEAVGPADSITVPHDAEVVDGKGLVVYPGFIDLFTTIGIEPTAQRSRTGSGRPIPFADFAFPRTPPDNRKEMTPEFQASSALDLSDSLAEARRRLGFTNLLIAPAGPIASGQSVLVATSGAPRRCRPRASCARRSRCTSLSAAVSADPAIRAPTTSRTADAAMNMLMRPRPRHRSPKSLDNCQAPRQPLRRPHRRRFRRRLHPPLLRRRRPADEREARAPRPRTTPAAAIRARSWA